LNDKRLKSNIVWILYYSLYPILRIIIPLALKFSFLTYICFQSAAGSASGSVSGSGNVQVTAMLPEKKTAPPPFGGIVKGTPVRQGDWVQVFDQSGNPYWLNEVSGVSAWQVPSDAAAATSGSATGAAVTGGYTIEL